MIRNFKNKRGYFEFEMSEEGQKGLIAISSIIASVFTDVTSLNDRFMSCNNVKLYPLAMIKKQQEDEFLEATRLAR